MRDRTLVFMIVGSGWGWTTRTRQLNSYYERRRLVGDCFSSKERCFATTFPTLRILGMKS
jgi:hypothetical protein